MIHYSIDTIIKEAEISYNQFNQGRTEDKIGRLTYIIGYIKTAYTKVYNDLPENKKQLEYLEKKLNNVLDNN